MDLFSLFESILVKDNSELVTFEFWGLQGTCFVGQKFCLRQYKYLIRMYVDEMEDIRKVFQIDFWQRFWSACVFLSLSSTRLLASSKIRICN